MNDSRYQFSRTPVQVPSVNTEYRRINTPIPAPDTESVLAEIEKYESRSMQGQPPIVWDHAENFSLFDMAGNKWIDFTSTIFVTNVGHANPRVVNAIKQVLAKPLLHTYAYANELRAKYIRRLIEFSEGGFEKAFLLSAGTEASEAVLKLMRMYAKKKKKHKPGIICIEGNFHGRTLGAYLMSNSKAQNGWPGYRDPNIHHIPFPYPWTLGDENGAAFLNSEIDSLIGKGVDIEKDICGFMLETYQGWGAVFYPKNFVQGIEDICRQNDILLAFDEMQAGFARTGKRFGYEHYEVSPDLICCGKGMGSGVPLSAVMGDAEIMDLPDVGEMSSTHSANPLVCAAGLATLDEIDEKRLIQETARKGKIFFDRLNNIKNRFSNNISFVFGRGLVAAMLFNNAATNLPDPILAGRIAERCMQKGVLVVHTGRESIKLAPPLTIPDEALNEAIDAIEESVDEILKES